MCSCVSHLCAVCSCATNKISWTWCKQKKNTSCMPKCLFHIRADLYARHSHTHAIGRVGQHKHSLTAYGFNSHPTVQVDLCVQKKNVRGIRTLESARFELILSNPRSSKADRNNKFIRLCASLIAVDWSGEFENINIYQHQSGSWIVDVILIILLCCSYQW